MMTYLFIFNVTVVCLLLVLLVRAREQTHGRDYLTVVCYFLAALLLFNLFLMALRKLLNSGAVLL